MSTAQRPAAPQLRKHTKTFTGCWTCRARRIRCDEGKPECRQCLRKGAPCEGYELRLQWVGADADENADPGLAAPRSSIPPDLSISSFPPRRVNQVLHTLDSLASARAAPPDQEVCHFIDCFGVFGRSTDSGCPSPSASSEATSSPAPHSPDADSESPLTPAAQPSQGASRGPASTPPEHSWDLASWFPLDPYLVSEAQQCDHPGSPLGEVSESLVNICDDNSYCEPFLPGTGDARGNHVQEAVPESILTLSASPFLFRPTPSSHLSSTERFLLNHYCQRTLYLFCVIDHEKSPWKTVHATKALQATGEFAIRGSMSRIREALITTLLSISSFFLANHNSSQLHADTASNWRTIASNYRVRAIELLRNAVESDFLAGSKPKHKEYLATALSMITMNVIAGDTDTCGIHLNGCFRLITQAQRWKRKYSPKAQSLHRIYFYLRAIYESTAPREGRREAGRLFLPAGTTTSPDIFCRELLSAQMFGYETGLNMDLEARITNCERIYGIPHTLLLLLTEVIDLMDKLDESTSADSTRKIPDCLMDECDALEKVIMDWPTVVGLEESANTCGSAKAEIVYRHTLAFYNALVIYFAQNIRRVDHRFLQPYVELVLESMETIESLKTGAEVLAAPLYWPGFIAGSEAFDPGLQARFRQWFCQVQMYGLESIRTGLTVLEQVWEAGPSHRPRRTCRWMDAVEKTGVRLMLS